MKFEFDLDYPTLAEIPPCATAPFELDCAVGVKTVTRDGVRLAYLVVLELEGSSQ